jgi:hypothetical protein
MPKELDVETIVRRYRLELPYEVVSAGTSGYGFNLRDRKHLLLSYEGTNVADVVHDLGHARTIEDGWPMEKLEKLLVPVKPGNLQETAYAISRTHILTAIPWDPYADYVSFKYGMGDIFKERESRLFSDVLQDPSTIFNIFAQWQSQCLTRGEFIARTIMLFTSKQFELQKLGLGDLAGRINDLRGHFETDLGFMSMFPGDYFERADRINEELENLWPYEENIQKSDEILSAFEKIKEEVEK